jgi:repressor LexA
MTEPLSPRQQHCLDFIAAWTAAEGRPPTLREIAAGLCLEQHSSAQRLVEALARKGWIERSDRHRGLRLVAAGTAEPTRERSLRPALLQLPLVGRVAAGAPILSDAHIDAVYAVDAALFRPRPHFLLRVEGDSMTGAGIFDGDFIAVHRSPVAEEGRIVVARVEDEITVKRLRREGERFRLDAENPAYAPIFVDPRREAFAIEGLYVGTIRCGAAT